MEQSEFDHTEKCEEPLDSASATTLLATLNHIMGPILDTSAKSILYDVSDCPSLDPGAVLLFCYAYELSLKQNRVVRIRGQGELIEELSEHFKHYQFRSLNSQATSSAKGLYLLRGIEDKQSMLTELQAWAESVREGTQASEDQVALWQMQIAEVTTNAFQHGPIHKGHQTGPCSIVAGKASGNIVQLAALDFGSTIPRVISDVAKSHHISDGDGSLIQFACRKGITSRSVKQNQGAGLYSLVQTVNESRGILQILSRNGLAYFSNGKAFTRDLPVRIDGSPAMDGTLTIINLHIKGESRHDISKGV